MKEVQKYLALLYLKAGVKIVVEDEDIFADFEYYNIEKIYNILMSIREEDYPFYLNCLSIIIFSTYFSIKANAELLECKENPEDKDYDLLNSFGQMDDDNQIYAPLLIEIFKNSKNTEDADNELMAHLESQNLMKCLISEHVGNTLECTYENLCGDIMYDQSLLEIYKKYVSPSTIQQCFISGINYTMEQENYKLTDFLTFVFSSTNSLDAIYELHNYILKNYYKKQQPQQIADYIYSILWETYSHCKNLEDTEYYTDKMQHFVTNFENDSSFLNRKCSEIILNPSISGIFELFVESVQIISPKDIDDIDIDALDTFSKECHEKIKDYIRKLLPNKK